MHHNQVESIQTSAQYLWTRDGIIKQCWLYDINDNIQYSMVSGGSKLQTTIWNHQIFSNIATTNDILYGVWWFHDWPVCLSNHQVAHRFNLESSRKPWRPSWHGSNQWSAATTYGTCWRAHVSLVSCLIAFNMMSNIIICCIDCIARMYSLMLHNFMSYGSWTHYCISYQK